MGTDPRPWVCWQSLPWQSLNSYYEHGSGIDLRGNSVLPNAQPMAFPSYAFRFGFGGGGDVPPAVAAPTVPQRSSAFPPPLDPMNAPSSEAAAAAERRFLIFDQSGGATSVLFSSIGSQFWNLDHRSLKPKAVDECGVRVEDMPGSYPPANLSDGTDVSDGGGGCDEMHEDTDEIDALLYSDSEYEDANGEEDEAFTAHSPQEMTASAEEVASNSVPTKRRRLNDEEAIDASLMDTASSVRAWKSGIVPKDGDGNKGDDESSCVGGSPVGGQELPRTGTGKGLKRTRIQETLCVLRKIIPGGKCKDDTALLDEAIRFLRSLKLKAKALGNKLK